MLEHLPLLVLFVVQSLGEVSRDDYFGALSAFYIVALIITAFWEL